VGSLQLQLTGASSNLIICCILFFSGYSYGDDTPVHHNHIIQERYLDVYSTHVEHVNSISDQSQRKGTPHSGTATMLHRNEMKCCLRMKWHRSFRKRE